MASKAPKVEIFSIRAVENTQYALKGQKLLAQGSALGTTAIKKTPCKVGCSKFESKIRYKKWCYFGAAKLLFFNTLTFEIVL